MTNGGGWIGFHVSAFITDANEWSWYYNTFLGYGDFQTNTWGGPAIQQFTCDGTNAQQYQFATTGGGFVRINNRGNAAQALDVAGVSTADNAPRSRSACSDLIGAAASPDGEGGRLPGRRYGRRPGPQQEA